MKENTPDDIAALCSHVNVDRGRYRVFSRSAAPVAHRRSAAALEEVADEPLTPDALPAGSAPPTAQSNPNPSESARPAMRIDNMARESSLGPRAVPRTGGERRALRNVWGKQSLGFEEAPGGQDFMPHRTVSLFAAGGGVGATTVAATLAKLFSRNGERAVVIDGRSESILPFFYGGKNGSSGSGAFQALVNASEGPLHVLTKDLWDIGEITEESVHAWLHRTFAKLNGAVDRAVIDIWPDTPQNILRDFCSHGICLVVAVPDLNSVLGVKRIANQLESLDLPLDPIYVINKFDASQPLHAEMRDLFAQQFRDQPITTIRRTDVIAEALADGMTVLDYAPDSGVADDYRALAGLIQEMAEAGSARALSAGNILRKN